VPYVVILQADVLNDFATVVLAPLMQEIAATKFTKLNPKVLVQGKTYRVSMSEMSSALRKHLGEVVASSGSQHFEFVVATDLIFTGV
jgi:CcdB protein